MSSMQPGPAGNQISRRDAMRLLGMLAAGLAGACTPLRIVFHAYPDDFARDSALADRVLRAFVVTVIPGVDPEDPNLTQVFFDDFYPLAEYRSFLASDLSERANRRFGAWFDQLTPAQRTRVIQEGLKGDPTSRKLYTGAVFLAQIATYGGIYNDEAGCPLIGFEGRYRFRTLEGITYPMPERFLARAATEDGNCA